MNKGTTIFIPVHNEVQRIEKAIRCAAPQCEYLLVSDNGSSDGTEAICRNLQAEYPNMKFFRQEENIGAMNNSLFLLKLVETPFVMALGSHDSIDSNYVEQLQSVLGNYPDTELAVGELYFEQDSVLTRADAFCDWKGGVQNEAANRVHSCIFDNAFLGWTAYGLFRTKTLKRILLDEDNPPYGIDMILLAKVAATGKVRVVQGTRYYGWIRDSSAASTTYVERILAKDRTRSETLKMRNTFRRSLFQIYKSAASSDSFWRIQKARFHLMVRIGMFKEQGPDVGYYILFVPVKITRRMQRLYAKFT